MFLRESLLAFIVAIVLSGIFAVVIRREDRLKNSLFFFLIIFLLTWAGGTWLRPFGPTVWGIHWLPFILVGVILVLFLAVLNPNKPPMNRHETIDMLERIEREKKWDKFTYISLSAFFWILSALLITAIVVRYL